MIKSSKMRLERRVVYVGEKKVYRVFMGKSEGKKLLGKYAHKWEDNIKMDLKEMGGGVVDWIHLAQDRDK